MQNGTQTESGSFFAKPLNEPSVKRLVTFSKCGDDSFVNTGVNNWSFSQSVCSKECADFSQTPVSMQLVKQERTEQGQRRDGMTDALSCVGWSCVVQCTGKE